MRVKRETKKYKDELAKFVKLLGEEIKLLRKGFVVVPVDRKKLASEFGVLTESIEGFTKYISKVVTGEEINDNDDKAISDIAADFGVSKEAIYLFFRLINEQINSETTTEIGIKELASDIGVTGSLIRMLENGRLTGIQTLFDLALSRGRILKVWMAPKDNVKLVPGKKRKK